MKTHSNSGFSILEILIAVALMGGLAVGGMKMMETMQKGQTTSETKMETMELKRIISNVMSDVDACMTTFQGKSIGNTVDQIKGANGTVLYEKGKIYGNSVKITGMQIVDQGAVSANFRAINLVIDIDKTKSVSMSTIKQIKIPMTVEASSPTAAIGSCKTPLAIHCQGSFSACSVTCGEGTRTFTVTVPQENGGSQCAYTNGYTEACVQPKCTTCSATNAGETQLDAGGNLEFCSGTAWVGFDLDVVFKYGVGTVQCDAGYKRVGCSGAREQNLMDTCQEQECGYIGTRPIAPEGCQTNHDSDSGTESSVWAICAKM